MITVFITNKLHVLSRPNNDLYMYMYMVSMDSQIMIYFEHFKHGSDITETEMKNMLWDSKELNKTNKYLINNK